MANGLYSNSELIGTVINDMNELLKEQAGGQYLNACRIVNGIVQKLLNLRQTVDNDIKNRDETIESLKEQIRSLGMEVVDMQPSEFLKEQNNGE